MRFELLATDGLARRGRLIVLAMQKRIIASRMNGVGSFTFSSRHSRRS
jgi:hypothetical protein